MGLTEDHHHAEKTTIMDLPTPLIELLCQQVSRQSGKLLHALVCRSWADAATDKGSIRGVSLESCSDPGNTRGSSVASRVHQHERILEIAGLESLEKLTCGRCISIPKLILSSSKLKTLHLTGNFNVLPRAFTKLSGLQDCKLSSSFLRGLPKGIGHLTALTSLEVVCDPNRDYGEFTSIPASIGLLTQLQRLVIKVGAVERIPESIRQLRKLRVLVLHTKMEEYPEFISELANLVHLDLRGHEVLVVPAIYSSLVALITLKLQGGAFQGLPDFFDSFPNMRTLVVSSPSLCQLPPSLSTLRKLQVLVVGPEAQLGSQASPDVFRSFLPPGTDFPHYTRDDAPHVLAEDLSRALNIPSLKVLRLCFGAGDAVERLPDSIPSLTSLRELEITSISFAPSTIEVIDDSLGRLQSLQVLAIAGQSITYIPSAISCLTLLKEFVISNCDLLRELPESLGSLPLLEDLCISSCHNLQSLPASIGGLCSLASFGLIFLPEIFQLPETLGHLSALRRLSLVRLQKLRALPSSFADLAALEVLAIQGCWKLASLPQDFGGLQRLHFLVLDNLSSLSQLPDSFGYLQSLAELHLFKCHRLSALPDSFRFLVSLRNLESIACGMGAAEPPVVKRLKDRISATRRFAAEGGQERKGSVSSGLLGRKGTSGIAGGDEKPLLEVKFEAGVYWAFDPPTVNIPPVRNQKAWTAWHRRVIDWGAEQPQGDRSDQFMDDEDRQMHVLAHVAHGANMQDQYDMENDYMWDTNDGEARDGGVDWDEDELW